MAWQTPKTDWATNPKNPKSEDFNRIEGNIDFLKTDIETKKGLIVTAINDMNQPALVTDTHLELANKIRSISSDANAAVGDVEKGKTFYAGGTKKIGTLELTGDAATGNVLSGKTFYNTDLKAKLTGTMPNCGRAIITPGTANKPIAQGYHDGTGYVQGDSDLVAANIKKGVNIFGVTGAYQVPWFNDWSAYSTHYDWSGTSAISTPAKSWSTLLNVTGEGALMFLRGLNYSSGLTMAVNPDVRVTVDGVAYIFSGSRHASGSRMPSRLIGNIVFQPICFGQSLKIEAYNRADNTTKLGIDYTYLLRTSNPDPAKQTLLSLSNRRMADLTSYGTLADISGSGYLLGILIGGMNRSTSQYAGRTRCSIDLDGVNIMSDRICWEASPVYEFSNLLYVFTGPIRFDSRLLVTIPADSDVTQYSRAWYALV